MKLTTKTFLNMGKKDKLNQSLIFHSSIWYLKFQIPLNHNRERIVSLISHFHNNNLNTKAKKKKNEAIRCSRCLSPITARHVTSQSQVCSYPPASQSDAEKSLDFSQSHVRKSLDLSQRVSLD